MNSTCSTESPSPGGDSESQEIVVVSQVKWPGASYTPSTGKQLRIFQLDNTLLRGKFTSLDDRVLYFKSTCSGVVHVWRPDGSNVIEHEIISETEGIHFAKIEQKAFVYGSTKDNGTYRMPDHKSKREAEAEYGERAVQGHASDDAEVDQAVSELESDPDTHLFPKLSQALGEFGIYGEQSPCSLPLHLTAMSVAQKLPDYESQYGDDSVDLEQFDCAERQRSDAEALDSPTGTAKRVRRGWFRSVVRAVVRRVVEPVRGWSKRCTPINHRYYNDCVGMCGRRCSCWRWICGNCCHNQGCYEHDLCCKKFVSIPCLIPNLTGFDCKSYSEYPGCLR